MTTYPPKTVKAMAAMTTRAARRTTSSQAIDDPPSLMREAIEQIESFEQFLSH